MIICGLLSFLQILFMMGAVVLGYVFFTVPFDDLPARFWLSILAIVFVFFLIGVTKTLMCCNRRRYGSSSYYGSRGNSHTPFIGGDGGSCDGGAGGCDGG